MKPRRIQLSRKRGWKKPENTVVVSRPSKWGNPYLLHSYRFAYPDGKRAPFDESAARDMAIRDFEHALAVGALPVSEDDVRRELCGKNLACWCPPSKKCHADVLLEVANSKCDRCGGSGLFGGKPCWCTDSRPASKKKARAA